MNEKKEAKIALAFGWIEGKLQLNAKREKGAMFESTHNNRVLCIMKV